MVDLTFLKLRLNIVQRGLTELESTFSGCCLLNLINELLELSLFELVHLFNMLQM